MEAVRRAAIFLIGLAFIALALAAASIPRDLTIRADTLLGLFDRATGTNEYWFALAVLAALGVLLILLAIAGARRRGGLLVDTDAGAVELPPSVVAEQIRRRVEALGGVRAARAEVVGRGRRADVRVSADVDETALDTGLAPRLTRAVRDSVESGTGLRLGRIRLDVRPVSATTPEEAAPRAA